MTKSLTSHMQLDNESDVLIAGGGIVGMAIARALLNQHPGLRITILEKEQTLAFHGSGRNSGVLHSGFYYSEDSLKAKLTRDGNIALTSFCEQNDIPLNKAGKLVVAQSDKDIDGIFELYRRGKANGVDVSVLTEKEASEIDPNVKTIKYALHSPNTSTVDPVQVCHKLQNQLISKGVRFEFGERFQSRISDSECITQNGSRYTYHLFINCAGLHADKVAKQFGFSSKYSIVPFKGIYLKYTKKDAPIRTNVYPVPNLKNPFLGVHYTITVDGTIKIGPTAIPAFWRENYRSLDRFKLPEFSSILSKQAELFLKNSFGFRSLAIEEMLKYRKAHFIRLASRMLHSIDQSGFTEWSRPGIRAQLLNVETNELVQDFVVESDTKSVHILNAISPAFTSSFPFGEWVYENHIRSTLSEVTRSRRLMPHPIG